MDFESFFNNPLFIISLTFWIISFLLIKILGKKKENISIIFPFIAMFKTKILNNFFKKIAKKYPRFWKIYWNVGVVASFIAMLFALYFFISNLITLIMAPKIENALIPLIPGVTVSLPIFSELLLPLLLTITVHEFSHAIAAERDGLNVNSSGIFGAGLFFIIGYGAFVELDDFQMYSKSVSGTTRLRISAAGIWSNIVLAGIFFLFLNSFPSIVQTAYDYEIIKVESVISAEDGGFNEGNVFPNDIIYKINDTQIDLVNGIDLGAILGNETDLKCSFGDTLIAQCYNESDNSYYNRTIVLGHKSYVGFKYEQYNNTAFIITSVDGWEQGGNNYEILDEGLIITKINGTEINYEKNITLITFLKEYIPDYKLNLTDSNGKSYLIDVNFPPYFPGTHSFESIYLGIEYKKIDNHTIQIIKVVDNTTQFGVNYGNISEGVNITAVNGTRLNLENQTFKQFLAALNPKINGTLVFTDINGENYTLNCAKKPIQPILVYIGITHSPYWHPKNSIGKLFKGNMPIWAFSQIFWTFAISFSIALFNLLPVSILDGGRIMKELIDKIIGTKWRYGEKTAIYYTKDSISENGQLKLNMHNIREILSIDFLTNHKLEYTETTSDRKKGLLKQRNYYFNKDGTLDETKYEKRNIFQMNINASPIDLYNDGFITAIEFSPIERIPDNAIIKVTMLYDKDELYIKKKNIYKTISWTIGMVILANFLISLLKFGRSIFWL